MLAASTFIAHHVTDSATPELADDRFSFLLTRIGNLIDIAAAHNDVDPGAVVLEVGEELDGVATGPDERAYRAAHTCMVAHHFVRRGGSPWGIQASLDRADMLVLNSALARILVFVACSFEEPAMRDAFSALLGEAEHILSCQAHAYGMTIERLIEKYFVALAMQDADSTSA